MEITSKEGGVWNKKGECDCVTYCMWTIWLWIEMKFKIWKVRHTDIRACSCVRAFLVPGVLKSTCCFEFNWDSSQLRTSFWYWLNAHAHHYPHIHAISLPISNSYDSLVIHLIIWRFRIETVVQTFCFLLFFFQSKYFHIKFWLGH